jgi:large conductance mechanosensitive channel
MAEREPTKATILKQVEIAKEQLDKIPAPKLRGTFAGFITFVREQGVVGLAVGLVLGVAAKSVVDSIVNNIFNPLIGLIGAGNNGALDTRYICLKHAGKACINKLGYGQLISDIISFLIVAFVVYFVVKSFKLDRLDKKKQ